LPRFGHTRGFLWPGSELRADRPGPGNLGLPPPGLWGAAIALLRTHSPISLPQNQPGNRTRVNPPTSSGLGRTSFSSCMSYAPDFQCHLPRAVPGDARFQSLLDLATGVSPRQPSDPRSLWHRQGRPCCPENQNSRRGPILAPTREQANRHTAFEEILMRNRDRSFFGHENSALMNWVWR
jgi:hypothetical protein